jgi:hypothetical protein
VDGNDPAWRQERNSYAEQERKGVDNDASRFRDWGMLKYWFRGVEKFAPWVNKIYFVTWGHVPEWLNLDHPKLKVVKHSDFIPAECLPTFNSNVIEFYFHRIEGLSDKFVYFNDDCFLLNAVPPTRFFRNGLPCDLGAMTINIHNGMFGASVLLAKTLVNEHFDKKEVVAKHPSKWFNVAYPCQSLLNLLCCCIRPHEFVGFVNPHLPQGYLRRTYDEVWAHCEKDLVRTCRHRFRDYGDIPHWLFRYWQVASGRFMPYNSLKDGRYYLVTDDNIQEVVDCIRRQKKKMVCLNDVETITDFNKIRQQVTDVFEVILPKQSAFEM